MTTDEVIAEVLAQEGGFVDHPHDRGGPTNYGITAQVLGSWRGYGRPATTDQVRTLTRQEAHDIYRERYVKAPRINLLPDPKLRSLLVDFGVHSGPRRAIQALQRALRIPDDGIIGPVTLSAYAVADRDEVYRAVVRDRGELLATILQRDPSQRVFAAGWMRRLMTFV